MVSCLVLDLIHVPTDRLRGILTSELKTSLPHSCTLEVIPLMGEVVEKVTSAVVDNDNLSAGVIKKQVDI